MKTVIKEELVKRMRLALRANKKGLYATIPTVPQIKLTQIVDELIRQINLSMVNGEQVWLKYLGRFRVRTLKRENIRNPKTGEEWKELGRVFRKVIFIGSKKMRERLNAKNNKPT